MAEESHAHRNRPPIDQSVGKTARNVRKKRGEIENGAAAPRPAGQPDAPSRPDRIVLSDTSEPPDTVRRRERSALFDWAEERGRQALRSIVGRNKGKPRGFEEPGEFRRFGEKRAGLWRFRFAASMRID